MIALAFLPAQSLAQLRRALPAPNSVCVTDGWDVLVAHVAQGAGDIIVVDPCVGGDRLASERVSQLAHFRARAPRAPVVGYVSVTAAAIHAVQSLVRSCDAEIVVRGVDDGTDALARTLQRAFAESSASSFVLGTGDQFASLPADIAGALTRLFRRPDRLRSVDDLASAACTTRRTLDRWLARAGLAPARTLLACARVSAAFHLLTAGNIRASSAAAMVGYTSPRALARELHWLTGFVPSAIPSDVTHAAFADALRPRLFRAGGVTGSSY